MKFASLALLLAAVAAPLVSPAWGQPDTLWFGGTRWDAVDARWEALPDSVWTFESGVGSHFNHAAPYVYPYKDPALHARMEGWVGLDVLAIEGRFFCRRSASEFLGGSTCVGDAAGLQGESSLYAGVTPTEAAALCFAAGQGYGDAWASAVEKRFAYDGSGAVVLQFDYVVDVEPGWDYAYVLVDTLCTVESPVDERSYQAASWTGSTGGHASLVLAPGSGLPGQAGCIRIAFAVESDGIYSDQDGVFPTSCGAFAVDQVSVSGGGIDHAADFESGDGGWVPSPPPREYWGEWSHLSAVADLPPPEIACPGLGDSVLLFENVTLEGETYGYFQENLAVSPWIDLAEAGVVGRPVKVLEFQGYFALPLLLYDFVFGAVQWFPDTCGVSGAVRVSDLTFLPQQYYFGGIPVCFTPAAPRRLDVSDLIPPSAERVRVALGISSHCPIGWCGEARGESPAWFNDVRFGVAAEPAAVAVPDHDVETPELPLAISPNPVRGGAPLRISFELSREQRVVVEVLDVAGRLVGTVFEGMAGPGSWGLRWSGRDDTGRPAPAGLYLIRLSAGESVSAQKVLVLGR